MKVNRLNSPVGDANSKLLPYRTVCPTLEEPPSLDKSGRPPMRVRRAAAWARRQSLGMCRLPDQVTVEVGVQITYTMKLCVTGTVPVASVS